VESLARRVPPDRPVSSMPVLAKGRTSPRTWRRMGASVCVLALAGHASAVTFPVSYSSNSRYLQDATGAPFPILGRTGWFITSLSQADYQIFLDDSVAKGHSAIEFHVVNHDPRGNNEPRAGNGALPFSKRLDGGTWTGALTYSNINNEAPDFTQPNEAYWTHVDALLAYAESHGLLAFMFPAYVGYAGGEQGWMQELLANGPTRIQTYGAWIAARYAGRKNIVWMMGGDMGTGSIPFNGPQTAVEQALLTGLKSVAGQQSTLFSAEWNSESIGTDQTTFGTSMTLNGAYSWNADVSNQCRRGYAHTPSEPAFLLEEPYDEEGPDGNSANPSATQPVRRFQWWGLLTCVGGYISGNGFIWPFNSGWQSHLDTQGAHDMARLNALVRAITWQQLVPSGLGGMGTIVTAGAGGGVSSPDYVAAAARTDGALVLAYVPPAHSGTITLDMTKLSSLARARWFNPTTAAFSAAGNSLPNTGTRVFTPPGNNGSGFSDWVLIVDLEPSPVALQSFMLD
jgi:Protein of unknown function (DUF4038)/Putative collagen-binding domain of a collagenase